jgi:arginine:agmatine antiporter
VIAAFALLKAVGTLAGWILLTAQVSQAAAERGLLPAAFARVRSGDTPALGLVAAAVLGTLAISLTISPTLGEQFGILIEASTLFALLTYAGACAGAVRRGEASDVALALVGGAFCVAVIAGSSRPALAATTLAIVVTALAWPLVQKRAKTP